MKYQISATRLALLAFLFTSILACTKNYINPDHLTTDKWNPEFGIGLLYGSFKIDNLNLTNSNSTLQIHADSSVSIVYQKELGSFTTTDFIPALESNVVAYNKSLSPSEYQAFRSIPLGAVFSLTSSQTTTVNAKNASSVKIDSLLMKTGELSVMVQNTFNNPCDVKLAIPKPNGRGDVLATSIHLNAKESKTCVVDMKGLMIDLSNAGQGYNQVRTNYQIAITKNSNDTGHIAFTSTVLNPAFKILYGDIGNQGFARRKADEILFDAYKSQSSHTGLQLADAQVKFLFRSSFGVPINFSLNEIKGINANQSFYLDTILPFTIPAAAQIGASAYDVLSLDKNNPKGNGSKLNLTSFFNQLPTSFLPIYSTVTNPSTVITKHNNFVLDTSKGVVSAIINLPLQLKMDGLQFKDTVPIDFGNITNVRSFIVRVQFTNGFPFSVNAALNFTDAQYHSVYLIPQGKLTDAAAIDQNGNVTMPAVTTVDFPFTEAAMGQIGQIKKLVFTGKVSSPNQGMAFANIKSGSSIDIRLGAKATLK